MSAGLPEVAAIVRRETGMVIKEAQFPALAAALRRIAPGVDPDEFAAAMNGDDGPPALLSRLVDEVTVQETYFFRELRDLQAIDWPRLRDRAKESGSGTVRVWVAACATGEEAYSIAILASEALGRQDTPVTILATDVSAAALARAAAGSGYSERSVRNLSPDLRQRYLIRDGNSYRVREGLKALVRFRRHNLITDSSPPLGEVPFDIVACRNVLIYFDRPTVKRVLRSLTRSVAPDGELILGAADRLSGSGDGFLAQGEASPLRERRSRRRRPAKERLRRPLGLAPEPADRAATGSSGAAGDRDERIEAALVAADEGDLEGALRIVDALVGEDLLIPDAYFVRGLVELERGDAAAAAASLRRCLYVDPSFGLAAFQLGRAQEALGDGRAARRAYEQALRTLDPEDGRHQAILDQVDLGDVAAACAARLRASVGGAR